MPTDWQGSKSLDNNPDNSSPGDHADGTNRFDPYARQLPSDPVGALGVLHRSSLDRNPVA